MLSGDVGSAGCGALYESPLTLSTMSFRIGTVDIPDRIERGHDLALPYRSGASWLAQLRTQPQTADIPVVILSAFPDVLSRERRELAQAYVRKPFQARTLVETVQAVCAGTLVADVDATSDPASTQPLESP